MKSTVISVIMFSLVFFLVTCEYESPPTQNPSDVENQILKKKPKPGNNPTSELITFVGDLAGSQVVEGCCPNAGPSPVYTMDVVSDKFPEDFRGQHTGNLFNNGFGRNLPWAYKFQFWWGGEDEYFIEIRGGVVEKDKRNKITTVTFTQVDTCWTWNPDGVERIIFLDFVKLTRAKL